MVKYLCILCVYYLLPVLFEDTGGYITYLLVIAPVMSFLCALFPSMKYGYELLFPVMCGLLFVPSAFLYFNETAIIYAIVYGACALFGSILGGTMKARFLNEKKSKMNQ